MPSFTDLKVVERLMQLGWKLGAYIACLCVARRQALSAGVCFCDEYNRIMSAMANFSIIVYAQVTFLNICPNVPAHIS